MKPLAEFIFNNDRVVPWSSPPPRQAYDRPPVPNGPTPEFNERRARSKERPQ